MTALRLSNYRLPEFVRIAADFGCEQYAYAVTPNVDHLIRFCDEISFRELYAGAEFILLDSRFLAMLLRFFIGARLPTCPGSDITAALFNAVIAPDDKIVVIGGTEVQAEILAKKYGLRGISHFDPPMGFIRDEAAVESCLQFIEQQSPFRFCLLAVGCPQQEAIAHALQTRGRARGLALCVGASINFLTGSERRAPKWMQRIGFEWLYRLALNPTRMAKRYLVRGPRIFLLLPQLKFLLGTTPPSLLTEPVASHSIDSASNNLR